MDIIIAANAKSFCQVSASSKSHVDAITPTTGAVKTDIAAIVVGSFATRKDHIT
tara:strand:- start:46 stop:207 length:162 start_codon:yes stop_codon:yes gene_type:complete